MLTLILVTFVLVGAAVLALAVGTIVSGRCLRGSCGGADVLAADGTRLTCESCPRRASAERYGRRASSRRT